MPGCPATSDDLQSTCTSDCSDTDGDAMADCADDCIDVDGDGYGIDGSLVFVSVGLNDDTPDAPQTAATVTATRFRTAKMIASTRTATGWMTHEPPLRARRRR